MDPKNAPKNFGTFGSFPYPLLGGPFLKKKKKIKKKTLASKTTVNPYQKLKNEKIPKIEFIFANNSATLFCEVSRCHKLVKNDVLDPKNAPKHFGTFGFFSYPLLGGPFLKKKLKKKNCVKNNGKSLPKIKKKGV